MAGTRLVLVSIISMIILLLLSSQALAREYVVGGKDGWVVKPSEDYAHWAQRNRFQVNDTLHFKYNKGIDSVVVVKKEDFDSCNANNPIQKMDNGDSVFQFPNSGLFYFITGNSNNCKNGQKLIVLVMAVRNLPPVHAAPPQLPPQKVPSAALNAPAPPPSDKSASGRVGVSVSLVLLAGFVGSVWFN